MTTVEVAYGITSLPPEKANAQRLLDLTRGLWGIENKLHYVRDVTLGEKAAGCVPAPRRKCWRPCGML